MDREQKEKAIAAGWKSFFETDLPSLSQSVLDILSEDAADAGKAGIKS
jgi:hypothetical protein